MLAGGSEQRKVASKLAHTPYRLLEIRPGLHDEVFPGTMSHLYNVRVVHGFSGFMPHSLYSLPADEFAKWRPQTADWIYETKFRGQREGILITNATPGLARFQWLGGRPRGFTVRDVGLGEIHLDFEHGGAGKLLWSDSYYPGWRVKANGMPVRLQKVEPCFSQMEIPADTQTLVLNYQPRFLHLGEAMASIGFLGMAALYWRRGRSNKLAITG